MHLCLNVLYIVSLYCNEDKLSLLCVGIRIVAVDILCVCVSVCLSLSLCMSHNFLSSICINKNNSDIVTK